MCVCCVVSGVVIVVVVGVVVAVFSVLGGNAKSNEVHGRSSGKPPATPTETKADHSAEQIEPWATSGKPPSHLQHLPKRLNLQPW